VWLVINRLKSRDLRAGHNFYSQQYTKIHFYLYLYTDFIAVCKICEYMLHFLLVFSHIQTLLTVKFVNI
jgi:hypothetical protein